MPIPQAQLDTWSNQGAVATSATVYSRVRSVLLAPTSQLAARSIDIYLQGSYANTTNIHGDSDVDIVAYYEDTFYKDMTALTGEEQRLHEASFPAASYHWQTLRDDALAALRAGFGASAVTLGTKAIRVSTGIGGMTADVLPAVQFRRYASFPSKAAATAHRGIQFFDSAGHAIVNYPKYHIANGETKNQDARTRGRYKPTIRVFKNFRNSLITKGLLGEGDAPSYFLECALFNAQDQLFNGAFATSLPAILSNLASIPFSNFICQNGVVPLFGSDSTQWTSDKLTNFLAAANYGWHNW